MQLKLWKYQGAGNDFLAIDSRKKSQSVKGREFFELSAFEMERVVKKLCDRRRGIGADGVLVLHDCRNSDFRMKYYNSDGSLGDMCGNGARCIVRFAKDLDIIGDSCKFDTDAGMYSAIIENSGRIILDFPDVESMPDPIEITVPIDKKTGMKESMVFPGTFQTVGVNHAVFLVDDVKAIDIEKVGPLLRYHEEFESQGGTNVNFVEPDGKYLHLRTYERGVEAETLACGTGAVATAISYAKSQKKTGRNRWKIVPTGGDELLVRFYIGSDKITDVQLGGPAEKICEIKIDVSVV